LGDDASTDSWGTMIAALPRCGQVTLGGVVVVVVGTVVVVVPGNVVVVVVVVVVVPGSVVVVVVVLVVEVVEDEVGEPVAVAGVGLTRSPPTRALPAPSNQSARQSPGAREGFTITIYLPRRTTLSRLLP